MRVHYLQHVHFEGLGYIKTWLNSNDHSITATRFFEENYTLPDTSEIDALIILGGPMGVYDEHTCSWLKDEKAFISSCIASGKKVMGICLGAQLMAVCLGADVFQSINKEIGWFPVSPSEECKTVPWLYDMFSKQPVVFHWHGDKFEIPQNGSFNFLISEANDNQAFYHNRNVIGLQFHLEITAEAIQQMLKHAGHELILSPYIQTETEINERFSNIENCNRIMAEILANWLSNE